MAGQTSFSRLATSTLRNLFISRPSVINNPHVATLRMQSRDFLKGLPEKPKKPLTAFFLFSEVRRNQLKKDHPDAKITELAKMLADEWKNVDPSIKEKYEISYKNAMTEYTTKALEYNYKLTEEQKSTLKDVAEEKKKDKENRLKRKALKEMNKPKRPRGAYVYFLKEYFDKNKDKFSKFTDFVKHSKEMWVSLSPEERNKFTNISLEDKKRYNKEMEVWEAKMIRLGRPDLVRHNTNFVVSKLTRPIKPKTPKKQIASSTEPTKASKRSLKPKPGKSE